MKFNTIKPREYYWFSLYLQSKITVFSRKHKIFINKLLVIS